MITNIEDIKRTIEELGRTYTYYTKQARYSTELLPSGELLLEHIQADREYIHISSRVLLKLRKLNVITDWHTAYYTTGKSY